MKLSTDKRTDGPIINEKMSELSWKVPELRVGHDFVQEVENEKELEDILQDDTPTMADQPAVLLSYTASDDETTPPANGSGDADTDLSVVNVVAVDSPSSSVYRGSLPREGALQLSLSPASSLLAVPGQAGSSRRRHRWICR